MVRWAPPLGCSDSGPDSQEAPVEIQGYRLRFGPKNTSPDTMLDLAAGERTSTVDGLSPGSTYAFLLSAKSRAGYGDVAQQEVEMPEYPPLGYPKMSDSVNATCCSLQFSWLTLTPEECNGVITEYTIAYREAGGLQTSTVPTPSGLPALHVAPRQITLPATESSYTILGLNHSTAYEVQLRAHTKAGPGPFSPPLVCRTLAFETGRADLRSGEQPSPSYHWPQAHNPTPTNPPSEGLILHSKSTKLTPGQFLYRRLTTHLSSSQRR